MCSSRLEDRGENFYFRGNFATGSRFRVSIRILTEHCLQRGGRSILTII